MSAVGGISASLSSAGGVGGRSTLLGGGASALAGISTAAARLARSTEEVSSGRAIHKPSDDVVGTDKALELRRALAAEDRYSRSGSDASAWLGTTDGALQQGITVLQRVRALTVQAGSDANSATARAALATEVRGLRDDVLSVANTTYLGRPVFGGTTGEPRAFTESGGVVTASPDAGTGSVVRGLAPGVTLRVDTSGTAAFGDGADSVFAVLDRVATAMTTGATESSAALADLDAALGRMTTALTDVGTRMSRVDSLRSRGEDRVLSLTSAKADVEEVDLAKSLMELSMHEKAYQAALGAAARTSTPTLLDFLR